MIFLNKIKMYNNKLLSGACLGRLRKGRTFCWRVVRTNHVFCGPAWTLLCPGSGWPRSWRWSWCCSERTSPCPSGAGSRLLSQIYQFLVKNSLFWYTLTNSLFNWIQFSFLSFKLNLQYFKSTQFYQHNILVLTEVFSIN